MGRFFEAACEIRLERNGSKGYYICRACKLLGRRFFFFALPPVLLKSPPKRPERNDLESRQIGMRSNCGCISIEMRQLVVFTVAGQYYGLFLTAIERILPALEVTPIPHAADTLLGIINVQGRIIPVVNTRRFLQFPDRAIELNDQFVLAGTAERSVALVVDEVVGILEVTDEEINCSTGDRSAYGLSRGVVKREDSMVLVYDIEHFLTAEMESALR